MKKISTLIVFSLLFGSASAVAISVPESESPHECGRTLLNGRKCAKWSSLFEIVDTIKDKPGVELRPYRWYSLRGKVVTKIVLHGINFDFDKSNIKADSVHILDENMSHLSNDRQVSIRIIGHTDNWGSDEYNQKLSIRRSKSVMNYFVSKGLDPDRVTATGYGESQPIDTNETDEGRYNNRRIEIEITRDFRRN